MTPAILTTAGTLARQLAGLDDLTRDLTIASILRTLSTACDGDASDVLADAAGDIEGGVFDRVDAIRQSAPAERQWWIDHSDGYWRACDMIREQMMEQAKRMAKAWGAAA